MPAHFHLSDVASRRKETAELQQNPLSVVAADDDDGYDDVATVVAAAATGAAADTGIVVPFAVVAAAAAANVEAAENRQTSDTYLAVIFSVVLDVAVLAVVIAVVLDSSVLPKHLLIEKYFSS